MAKFNEIRVGSILTGNPTIGNHQLEAGIVLRMVSVLPGGAERSGSVDIYWFRSKKTDWEYPEYLTLVLP